MAQPDLGADQEDSFWQEQVGGEEFGGQPRPQEILGGVAPQVPHRGEAEVGKDRKGFQELGCLRPLLGMDADHGVAL